MDKAAHRVNHPLAARNAQGRMLQPTNTTHPHSPVHLLLRQVKHRTQLVQRQTVVLAAEAEQVGAEGLCLQLGSDHGQQVILHRGKHGLNVSASAFLMCRIAHRAFRLRLTYTLNMLTHTYIG